MSWFLAMLGRGSHSTDGVRAFATLCVHLGPDGSQVATYNHLLDTAKSWADKLRTSFFKEPEANAALKTTILKKLVYPLLPALSLTEAQCNAIMWPVLLALYI
jgi:hypothetical protein